MMCIRVGDMVLNDASPRVPFGARGIVKKVSDKCVMVKWTDIEDEFFNTLWMLHNDIILIGEDDYYTEKEKANFKAMQRASFWGAKWRSGR